MHQSFHQLCASNIRFLGDRALEHLQMILQWMVFTFRNRFVLMGIPFAGVSSMARCVPCCCGDDRDTTNWHVGVIILALRVTFLRRLFSAAVDVSLGCWFASLRDKVCGGVEAAAEVVEVAVSLWAKGGDPAAAAAVVVVVVVEGWVTVVDDWEGSIVRAGWDVVFFFSCDGGGSGSSLSSPRISSNISSSAFDVVVEACVTSLAWGGDLCGNGSSSSRSNKSSCSSFCSLCRDNRGLHALSVEHSMIAVMISSLSI